VDERRRGAAYTLSSCRFRPELEQVWTESVAVDIALEHAPRYEVRGDPPDRGFRDAGAARERGQGRPTGKIRYRIEHCHDPAGDGVIVHSQIIGPSFRTTCRINDLGH
jgi:hypothetical protein